MQHRFIFALAIVLISMWSFSCKKEDPINDDTTGNDEVETTITFYADKAGENLEGVLVGLATSSTDRANGQFLRSGTTDGFGKVKFEFLEPYTYYWSASYTEMGNTTTRSGQVTMETGDRVTRDISF